jgi:hypothetical protein
LFAFICIVIGNPIIEGRFMIPLTSLIPPYICACPNPRPGFPVIYFMVFFVFNGLKWEVVAYFVDIGEIVNQITKRPAPFQITAHPIFCRFNHVLVSGARNLSH